MAKTSSVESELQAVASMCGGDPQVSGLLMSLLRDVHFGCPETLAIHTRISTLLKANKPLPTLNLLKTDPSLPQEAQELLSSDVELCADEDEARALLHQLEQFRKLRVIYKGTSEVVKSMNEPTVDVTKAIDILERVVVQARSDFEEVLFVTAGDGDTSMPVIEAVLSKEKPDRIKTGFKKFDEASGGFARKDLVLIAANTGGGKSVMANQLAINAYLTECRNVAIVSFEMDDQEIYARVLSSLTGIHFEHIYLHKLSFSQDIKCRKVWADFIRHGKENNCKFVIWCPTVDVTPTQVGAVLKPGNFDEIIVDYVGLVQAEKEASLWENLGEITKGFKGVARRNNCVVVVMAQLDEESNKVKYSKAMRHHSSYVWKWMYGEESEETGLIVVEQEKARQCKRFNFTLIADFSTMTMRDANDAPPVDMSKKEEAELRKRSVDVSGEVNAVEAMAILDEARKKFSQSADLETPVPPEPKKTEPASLKLKMKPLRSARNEQAPAPEPVPLRQEPESPPSGSEAPGRIPVILPTSRGARNLAKMVNVTSAEDL